MAAVFSIAIGVVLLLSGGAKIAAAASWPAQAHALGAPTWAVRPLPWVEIVVGALACAQLARPWPAALAGVMIVAFTVLIVQRLREGKRPPCACFGSWSAKPLGWSHVARNGVFVALALAAVLAARPL